MLSLSFAQMTDRGRVRPKNEDSMAALAPSEEARRLEEGSLFVVADGMGGLPMGEVASLTAVEKLKKIWEARSDLETQKGMRDAFQEANRAVYSLNEGKDVWERMGTTLTASLFRAKRLTIGHVGDSRVYRVRGKKIELLTRDHSIGRNVLTSAIGTAPELEMDVFFEAIAPGDRFLQCTDGLYGYVEEEAIRQVIAADEPANACRRLVDLANAAGGPDNITVQAIYL